MELAGSTAENAAFVLEPSRRPWRPVPSSPAAPSRGSRAGEDPRRKASSERRWLEVWKIIVEVKKDFSCKEQEVGIGSNLNKRRVISHR